MFMLGKTYEYYIFEDYLSKGGSVYQHLFGNFELGELLIHIWIETIANEIYEKPNQTYYSKYFNHKKFLILLHIVQHSQ